MTDISYNFIICGIYLRDYGFDQLIKSLTKSVRLSEILTNQITFLSISVLSLFFTKKTSSDNDSKNTAWNTREQGDWIKDRYGSHRLFDLWDSYGTEDLHPEIFSHPANAVNYFHIRNPFSANTFLATHFSSPHT